MFLSALLFVVLSFILCFLLFHGRSDGGSRLPPSPPRLPVIGNLHQLSNLPQRSLRALSEKHGPVMLLRLGCVPTLVVSSVDAAREVMKTHDLVFASRPSLSVGRLMLYNCIDLAFAPYGEHWRRVRKLSVTHLFSAKMVQSFRRGVREEEVASMIDNISSSTPPLIVDMSGVLYNLTTNILSRVVSGKLEDGRRDKLHEIVVENNDLLAGFHVVDVLPWYLGWLDVFFGSNRRAKRNAKRWDDVLDEIIRDHRADRSGSEKEMDFVAVLLSLQKGSDLDLTDDHVKALLVDMFAAGTDTSYLTLEWAMAELVRNPKTMSKLQDEVRGIAKDKAVVREEDIHHMSYLKAVLKEVLRLHPPVPLLLPRESMEDCEVQGYRVPKKTRVIINTWAIGRDRESWEAHEEFQPERFINSDVDFKGNDFQFIPFGAGRRICPGMNFAISTTELALANLVHMFNWELPIGTTSEGMDMAESPGLTAGRKHKLHLVAKLFTC